MKASFYKIIFDKTTPFRCTYIDKSAFDHPSPPLKIKTLFVVLNYETGFLKLTQHELHFNYLDSGKVDFLPDHLNYVQYHY